ncbi:hypothetical protein [Desulfovibrio sp. Huiquan2017]|uniref:hypothetical protein n=1 Tax=Desulfovibrio sp. Huiquan2017 TaxID=2816861 RepID=UPI001A932415|nr:hypothetical protein [Desulfovibrio sp. Huiquan2017]
MNLEEFITESLKQIIDGVRNAQEFASAKGAIVAPSYGLLPGVQCEEGDNQTVMFNVAVTVQESSGQDGQAGLRIPFFDAKGTLSSEQLTGTISKISFAIPIELPVQKS